MIEGGRRVRRAACTALAVLYACTSATWTAPATAAPNAKTDVLVFAAASTANAIGEVVALYTADGRGIARASFASSGTLARQIELGAPANVFISANKKWMDYLAGHRLIVAGSRFDLFGNRLVLIAPAARKFKLAIVPGFALARTLRGGRLALADPAHVPAGIYARQALISLGVWDKVATLTARTGDVRAALALVARGEVPAGIVYATDLRISRRVELVGTFPPASHAPITYPAALIAANDTQAAHRFYAYLLSDAVQRIFARHGFAAQ